MSFSNILSSYQNHFGAQLNAASNPKDSIPRSSVKDLVKIKITQLWQRFNEWRINESNEAPIDDSVVPEERIPRALCMNGVDSNSLPLETPKNKRILSLISLAELEKKYAKDIENESETGSGKWKMGLAVGFVSLLGLSTLALYQANQSVVNPKAINSTPDNTEPSTDARTGISFLDTPTTDFSRVTGATAPFDFSSNSMAALTGGLVGAGLIGGGIILGYNHFKQKHLKSEGGTSLRESLTTDLERKISDNTKTARKPKKDEDSETEEQTGGAGNKDKNPKNELDESEGQQGKKQEEGDKVNPKTPEGAEKKDEVTPDASGQGINNSAQAGNNKASESKVEKTILIMKETAFDSHQEELDQSTYEFYPLRKASAEQVKKEVKDIQKYLEKEVPELKENSEDYRIVYSKALLNLNQNRYVNVLCKTPYTPNFSDNSIPDYYLNADLIPLKDKSYVATQGPIHTDLVSTLMPFFTAVMLGKSNIVTLTMAVEKGREKSFNYWDSKFWNKIKKFEIPGGTITFIGEEEYKRADKPDEDQKIHRLVKRNFRFIPNEDEPLKEEIQKRDFCQYHYENWPDHGIPDLKLFREFRQWIAAEKQEGPLVVHCSAGRGRTGTFIALDHLIESLEEQIKEGKEPRVDIRDCVKQMREKRERMISEDDQIEFLHTYLLDHAKNFAKENNYTWRQFTMADLEAVKQTEGLSEGELNELARYYETDLSKIGSGLEAEKENLSVSTEKKAGSDQEEVEEGEGSDNEGSSSDEEEVSKRPNVSKITKTDDGYVIYVEGYKPITLNAAAVDAHWKEYRNQCVESYEGHLKAMTKDDFDKIVSYSNRKNSENTDYEPIESIQRREGSYFVKFLESNKEIQVNAAKRIDDAELLELWQAAVIDQLNEETVKSLIEYLNSFPNQTGIPGFNYDSKITAIDIDSYAVEIEGKDESFKASLGMMYDWWNKYLLSEIPDEFEPLIAFLNSKSTKGGKIAEIAEVNNGYRIAMALTEGITNLNHFVTIETLYQCANEYQAALKEGKEIFKGLINDRANENTVLELLKTHESIKKLKEKVSIGSQTPIISDGETYVITRIGEELYLFESPKTNKIYVDGDTLSSIFSKGRAITKAREEEKVKVTPNKLAFVQEAEHHWFNPLEVSLTSDQIQLESLEAFKRLEEHAKTLPNPKNLEVNKFSIARANSHKNRNSEYLPLNETIYAPKELNGEYVKDYYYHGSLIDLKSQLYVAAQGPQECNNPNTPDADTVNEFWKSVVLSKTELNKNNERIIVTLTKDVENNRLKCFGYWNSSKTIWSITDQEKAIGTVTRNSDEKQGDFVRQRTFTFETASDGEKDPIKFNIQHFNVEDWNDHKAPSKELFSELQKAVSSHAKSLSQRPLIFVHCASGIGRTGTYIALDHLIKELEEQMKTDVNIIKLDVEECVKKMRESRYGLIENNEQLAFIYEFLVEYAKKFKAELASQPPVPGHVNNGQLLLTS